MKLDVDAAMRFYSVINKDEYYIKKALLEAKKAFSIDEVPVGCVIVYQDKIIARGHNQREQKQNSLCHAELVAIHRACKKIGSWRLEECTMYITLEPCVMCGGAIVQSRIPRVVYGAYDYRFGAHQSLFHLFDVPFNHKVELIGGVLEEECSTLLKSFFKKLREKKIES